MLGLPFTDNPTDSPSPGRLKNKFVINFLIPE
jgi:hypothetical protein